jgi:2,4-dienoyl-CoA reductase-like NADH-dependent reductase (Old Yellow Enzyme family)
LVFGTPREMFPADIERVVSQFVSAAQMMADSGFSGVQLHAAHGYLLGTIHIMVKPSSLSRSPH